MSASVGYEAGSYPGCTAKQGRFAELYVAAGGRGAARCAAEAGYSDKGDAAHVRANELLRHDGVLRAIKFLCETQLRGAIAQATAQLQHLMMNGGAHDGVKFRAAEAILDRGGMLLAQQINVNHSGSVDIRVRVADIRRRAEALGIDPRKFLGNCSDVPKDVIDAEFEEAKPAPAITGREGLKDVI